MAALYVPFIIPFVVVVLASAPLLGLSATGLASVWGDAVRRLALPAVALAGALVFVKLMMHGGEAAPVVAIGRSLADVVASVHAPLWLGAAPVVGALGSFFSGSATVSNLTFAPVQAEIAQQLGLEGARVLALQAVGGAMGNMVCIHNIVAVAAVLGLTGGQKRGRPSTPITISASGEATGEAFEERDPIARILRLNALPLAAFALVAAIIAAATALL
jgi:lactate permease